MKTKLLSIIGALLLVAATGTAQTTNGNSTLLGGIGEIGSALATATNWTVTAGYGHALKGNGSLGFADLAYNFSENVGVVLGVDNMFGGGKSEWNDVRGGVSLSLNLHPFAFIGGTNFLTRMNATTFVADLMATPRNGNAIGNILVTGVAFDLFRVKNFDVGFLAAWEQRSGQGDASGKYLIFGVKATRKF